MRHYGLIGYPLGHSFSASYFNGFFEREGIEAVYRNFPLEHAGDFRKLLEAEPGLCGLNVTVPYKEKIIPFLDRLSPTAQAIGAVNTISLKKDRDRRILEGDNTDVTGFRRSLEQHLEVHHRAALVLGTGGSSKAVHHVLQELGIDFRVVSRNPGENKICYEDLDSGMIAGTPLIINTTPLGMHPRIDTFPNIPYEALSPEHMLFDLVYNPEMTAFLQKGKDAGAKCVNGHEMLIYQAQAAWDIWNGK